MKAIAKESMNIGTAHIRKGQTYHLTKIKGSYSGGEKYRVQYDKSRQSVIATINLGAPTMAVKWEII